MTPGHHHENICRFSYSTVTTRSGWSRWIALVGSAARTYLIADERTEELTRDKYASLAGWAG